MNYTAFQEHALERLKAQQIRITRTRRSVIALLSQLEEPLSAYELKARLDAEGNAIDTVSVYRILECFEHIGLVHRVGNSGKVFRCGHAPHDKDRDHRCCDEINALHPLLVCRHCGQIDEPHSKELDNFLKELQQISGFIAQAQSLEIRGLCKSCQ